MIIHFRFWLFDDALILINHRKLHIDLFLYTSLEIILWKYLPLFLLTIFVFPNPFWMSIRRLQNTCKKSRQTRIKWSKRQVSNSLDRKISYRWKNTYSNFKSCTTAIWLRESALKHFFGLRAVPLRRNYLKSTQKSPNVFSQNFVRTLIRWIFNLKHICGFCIR